MDRVDRALAKAAGMYDIDGLFLVKHEAVARKNVQYLTGFSGSSAYVIVTPKARVILTDGRYAEQAGKQCPGFEVIQHSPAFAEDVREVAARLGLRRLGFESDAVLFSVIDEVQRSIPHVDLVATMNVVGSERALKEDLEIAAIRRAADITTDGFEHILGFIEPGVTEQEIAMELEYHMRRNGASGLAFDMIVASGARGSMQHGAPSTKIIQTGEFVLMDFGVQADGYLSDMTRTVMVGRASDEQRKVYHSVRQAQQHGLDIIKAGMRGHDVWDEMRKVVADAGFGEYAGRRFGHAFGLEIHESPYLIEGSRDVLAAGNVVTVEPGAYIPGWGGVRIEDMAVVTATGCTVLNGGTKDLVEL
ncbi:MAG: aminopeptidase P family protein [Clostridia bacterium]|nr:aminopeptidase P family protein [Clostridia bacterium]